MRRLRSRRCAWRRGPPFQRKRRAVSRPRRFGAGGPFRLRAKSPPLRRAERGRLPRGHGAGGANRRPGHDSDPTDLRRACPRRSRSACGLRSSVAMRPSGNRIAVLGSASLHLLRVASDLLGLDPEERACCCHAPVERADPCTADGRHGQMKRIASPQGELFPVREARGDPEVLRVDPHPMRAQRGVAVSRTAPMRGSGG